MELWKIGIWAKQHNNSYRNSLRIPYGALWTPWGALGNDVRLGKGFSTWGQSQKTRAWQSAWLFSCATVQSNHLAQGL